MRSLRAAWRLGRALVHGLHGVSIVLLLFPWLDRAARCLRIRWWAAKMLHVLGARLQVSGQFRPGAKLIVVNHVSWLDIMAIHATCPQARFVAKADVQRWPLVRRLVAASETMYLARERRRDAVRVMHQMAEALQAGDSVAIFPEGTTGDGRSLLPFHANLLQAAVATAVPVQAVALRYADRRNPVSAAAAWVGDTTLVDSLWHLCRADGMVVHAAVLPAAATAHADRRALAARLRGEIEAALAAIDGARR